MAQKVKKGVASCFNQELIKQLAGVLALQPLQQNQPVMQTARRKRSTEIMKKTPRQ